MWNRHTSPAAHHLAALPILPLARVVLLPGMTLPVNIHDPDARALVDHVRGHGQHLGVPLAIPGLPLPSVFTLARIFSHVEISSTHRLIRVIGLCRVEALQGPPTLQPFRAVAVRALAEPRPQDATQLAILRAQVERILAAAGDLALRTLLDVRDDRVFLYALTAVLPALALLPHRDLPDAEIDGDDLPAAQQQCLAAATPDERAAILVARTAAVLAGLARTGRDVVLH